jgi:hypothetical protein
MLNQLLKFTLLSSLLLWLKPRWRSLLAFCALVILVHIVHNEYLGYVELSGEQAWLVWSYVVKWIVLLSGTLAYIFYGVSGPKSLAQVQEKPGVLRQDNPSDSSVTDDGFEFLRNKKHLQNRAEKLVASEKRTG